MQRASITLCLNGYSGAMASTLRVESMQRGPSKGNVRVDVDGGCVRVDIEAWSTTGLIALINSYMLLAHASYSALRAAEMRGGPR